MAKGVLAYNGCCGNSLVPASGLMDLGVGILSVGKALISADCVFSVIKPAN
jgi:hypothetical protein